MSHVLEHPIEEHRPEDHETHEDNEVHNADEPVIGNDPLPSFNQNLPQAPKVELLLDGAPDASANNPIFADPKPNDSGSIALQGSIGRAAEENAGDARREMELRQGTGHSGSGKVLGPEEAPKGLNARKISPDSPPAGFLKAYPMFGSGPKSNPDAWSVKPADFQDFLRSHPDAAQGKYAIIDLRDSKNAQDYKGGAPKQLKGASHAALNEDNFRGLSKLSFNDFVRFNWISKGAGPTTKEISDVKAKWAEARKEYPWNQLHDKDIVFFHCRQSSNRTPFMASGYLEYGRPDGSHQKVVIIEGGYDGGDSYPADLVEDWHFDENQKYW